MEVKNVVPIKEVLTEDVSSLLDELITDGRVSREFTVTDRLKITLRTLTIEEILEADTVNIAAEERVPKDVIDRVRGVCTLVYATEKLNNIKIIVDDWEKTRANRNMLREKYMKFPPGLFEKIYGYYLELVDEVNKKLLVNIGSNIENF